MSTGINRMYSEFAYLWPVISSPADYAEEASLWHRALIDHLGKDRKRILELGVGGGNNLSHLTKDFQATAVDISPAMLEECRKINPEVELLVGDMRRIRLERTFDAVLIHDAICYMTTERDLLDVFATAAAHLEPGGIIVTTPDYFLETFKDGVVRTDSASNDEIQLTHISYEFDPVTDDTSFETLMIYIIRDKFGVRVEQDRHILGLFPRQRWGELLEQSGFTVEERPYNVHDDGRPSCLFVGVKR